MNTDKLIERNKDLITQLWHDDHNEWEIVQHLREHVSVNIE